MLTFAVIRPSVCLSVVCLSVTFVYPTQAIEIFGNIFALFGTLDIYCCANFGHVVFLKRVMDFISSY